MSDEAAPRQAHESVLSAHFAHARLSASGLAYLYGSALPSLVLWVHAWHPLPDLLVWLAALGWGSCAILAGVCGWAAWKCRARIAAALPDSRSVARVEFSPADPAPAASSFLLLLSITAGGVLWLHGLAPGLVAPGLVVLGTRAWALLVAAALGNRYVEALS
jgi:hypothetical protein